MTGSDDSGPDKNGIGLCEQCSVPMVSRGGREYCRDCADGESVPIAELERLADEWERQYQKTANDNHTTSQVKNHVQNCANDLSSLIAEYGGPDE